MGMDRARAQTTNRGVDSLHMRLLFHSAAKEHSKERERLGTAAGCAAALCVERLGPVSTQCWCHASCSLLSIL